MEKRYFRRGGGVVWVNLTVSMIHAEAGAPEHFIAVIEDITGRKTTEAALGESQARLQAIFQTVPVSIVFVEAPSGRLVFGNAGVDRVFRFPMRYSRNPGDYDEWEAYHDSGRRVESREFPMAMTLASGCAARGEYQFMCGDGVRRWIAVATAPIHNDVGDLTGVVAVCTDIDDQRQAQIILSRDKQQLEGMVAARTRELQAAQVQLAHAQRVEALGQLSGGIAHDFNNVMQAVQSAARLIERRPSNVDRVRSFAAMIMQSTARGASITRRLLAFSRRGDLRAEPVDVSLLLDSMREILTHTLGTGIEVQNRAEDGLPALLADKGQLETVLVNLSTNARDAMGGEGILSLAAACQTVTEENHPALLRPGRYIRLLVSDTGVGMPPDILVRASEPFFTTKSVDKGTGLGLAMSRGFSEQSGGGLHIESEVGRGTTVYLWFPVALGDAVPAATADVPAPAPPTARHARLLMVDDELNVREALAQQMQDEGFLVRTADSGPQALARLDDGESFDLVVADLSMPGMDGLTLMQEIQRRRPALPFILLTGFATSAVEVALSGTSTGHWTLDTGHWTLDTGHWTLDTGHWTLLRKPIEAQELAKRVAVMLEGAPIGG